MKEELRRLRVEDKRLAMGRVTAPLNGVMKLERSHALGAMPYRRAEGRT